MDCELSNLIKEDSVLPAHIKPNGKVVKASEINTILLTGITGHLGPYVLKYLLEKENVKLVYCLVRDRSIKAAENLQKILKTDRAIIICGDLSKECFGLDAEMYDHLLESVDTIVHMAVKNHHLEAYKKNEGVTSDIRTINVFGTLKLLEFACMRKQKRMIYGSSVGACNRLSEDGILSEELIEESNFGNGITMGYLISKFICEKLLTEAIRRGMHCIIIRYAAIVGEKDSGEWSLNSNVNNERSHLFLLWVAYLQTRMKPVYWSAFSTVPVDICAIVTMQLIFNDNVPCGIFNLPNPHGSENDDFCTVATKLGFSVAQVDMKTFSRALREREENNEKVILAPLRKIYFGDDAEEQISQQCFYMKLMCQKNAGDIVNKVSEKFKKFVPNYESTIATPNEILYEFLSSRNVKSYI